MRKPKVAFICVHNSCRSQIAEALGKHLAGDVFESYSAGTETKPQINQDAVRIMKELYEIDMEQTQYSKLLSEIPPVDIVITMGCNVQCPMLPCKHREDWELDDPTGKPDVAFKETIQKIEEKMLLLKTYITDNTIETLSKKKNMTQKELDISIPELLSEKCISNQNRSGNMLRSVFYVCPICGNILHSTGACMVSCCGVTLPPLKAEAEDEGHVISVEQIETDSYITLEHEMSKEHYISFIANVTSSKAEIIKLYPEQNAEVRMMLRGHGILYAYCNKHGLIKKRY